MVPCDGNQRMIQKMCYESEYSNITEEDIQRIVKYLEFKANQILMKNVQDVESVIVNMSVKGDSLLKIVEDK